MTPILTALFSRLRLGFVVGLSLALPLANAWGQTTSSENSTAATSETASPETASPETAASVAEAKTDDQLGFLFDGTTPKTIEQLRLMETQVRQVTEKVKPATVNIRVGEAQGTGVIVTADGYVLTAAHVIARPDERAVITMADGKRYEGKTLGLNRSLDSGMLKIETKDRLPYVEIGESNPLKSGQWVVAIGHPGGLDPARGMVVRVGRLMFSTRSVLRTDCVLVGGDSGGPLVDMNGDLIGIHSRIGSQLWENIHVPIDGFSDEWDQLTAGEIVGQTPAPYLGLNVVDETNKIASVVPASPAFAAGLKADDLVIRIGDKEIKNKRDIGGAIKDLKIGQEITIVVQRGSQNLTLKLQVGRQWQ